MAKIPCVNERMTGIEALQSLQSKSFFGIPPTIDAGLVWLDDELLSRYNAMVMTVCMAWDKVVVYLVPQKALFSATIADWGLSKFLTNPVKVDLTPAKV
jgi:hypothetical protein